MHARVAVAIIGFVALALAIVEIPASAGEPRWTVRLEPMALSGYGHDQHVLTTRSIDLDASPALDSRVAAPVETGDGSALRAEILHQRDSWSFGIGLFWFLTKQPGVDLTAAADGPAGAVDEVRFAVADREFVSADPGDVLYYDLLEDTDLAIWTVDAFALKRLAAGETGSLSLQLGLRLGDFDNDYRAVAGIENAGGTRVDASSNYGLMPGPIVGLLGTARRGRHVFEGYLGQSVLLGKPELSNKTRDFVGPFEGDATAYVVEEALRQEKDVAIPITEARLHWRFDVSERVALGLGVNVSAWWDIPVPPGVNPGPGQNEVLLENTIVLVGLAGAVEVRF